MTTRGDKCEMGLPHSMKRLRLLFSLLLAGMLPAVLSPAPGHAQAVGWDGVAGRLQPEFQPGHWGSIYAAAGLASLTQKPPDQSEAAWRAVTGVRLAQWGFPRYAFLQAGTRLDLDPQGFVASNDRLVVLGFRGTEPTKPQDLVTDVRIEQLPAPELGLPGGARVHAGFLRAARAVASSMLREVAAHSVDPDGLRKPVWLVGHSMGGAISILSALRLSLLTDGSGQPLLPRLALFTFGMPRVGNPAFCAAFAQRVPASTRVVYGKDWVPCVPPSMIPLTPIRYQHVANGIYFGPDNRLRSSPTDCPFTLHAGFFDRLTLPSLGGVMERGVDFGALGRRFTNGVGTLARSVTREPDELAHHHLEYYLRALRLAIPEAERAGWPPPP